MSFINAASVRFHDLCRSLFNVEVALRKDSASSRGKRATPKSRVLRLEALENRELLSVEPILSAPFESADAALVALAPEHTPIAVLSEQDMRDLVSSGVLEDSVAEKVASTQWNAGKRWFYYDDGMWDGKFVDKQWVNVNWDYEADKLIEDGPLCQTIKEAAGLGLNGMVWKCYVDDLADPVNVESAERALFLQAVQEYANSEGRNIEIIPTIWLVGGNAFLSQDPNLVEGELTRTQLHVQVGDDGGVTEFIDATSVVPVSNGDMEGWDGAGVVPDSWSPSVADLVKRDAETANGKTNNSLLMTLPVKKDENGATIQNTSDYVSQIIDVTPGEYYAVSCRVKMNVDKSDEEWHAADIVISDPDASDYKELAEAYYDAGSTSVWTTIQTERFMATSNKISIGLRGTGAPGEKFWFDDVVVLASASAQEGIITPIQRDGTPMRVYAKNESGEYVEIKQVEGGVTNWKLPDGYKLKYEYGPDFYVDRFGDGENSTYVKSVNLEIPKDSRIIKENIQTVYVDYYKPKPNRWGSQKAYSVCLSEEKLYELMEASASIIQQTLQPKTWFIAFDEVTIGGTCETCADSGLTTARIFGKSVARQYDIIRNTEGVDPNAEIVVWSDMFYTGHNALEHYEDVQGSLTDVVNYIPNDLIIACWYDDKDKSSGKSVSEAIEVVSEGVKDYLKFFSDRGFRTMAASYYDWEEAVSNMPVAQADANTQGWLDAIADPDAALDNNVGMIYTTWDNRNYDYLDSFGSALRQVKDGAAPIGSISLSATFPVVGTALTATFSPDAAAQSSATYQWYRKEYDADIKTAIWKAIAGATSATYAPTSDDVGMELKVAAVGIGNYSGTVFARTNPVRSEDLGVADIAFSDPGKISNVAIVPNGAWSVDGIVVTNAGESESDDVALSFYATVSGTIDERSIFLKKIVCNRLAPGEVATVSSGILPTDGLAPGQAYRIVWKAECSNDVATANNVGSTAKNVTVCPEADPVDVVDFDRESYSPRQGDAFWLATWLNSGATGPNKHAFWFDFGDGTYVERANSGVVMPNDYPSAAGNATISVKVVDLTIKKIVAKGTASLNIVQATPSFYIEPESAFDGDALILSVEAFFPVPTAVSKWTFDWGDGEKTVLEQLSLKANASHYYAPNHKLRVVTLSVAFDDADFSVTFDAETLRR